MTFTTEEHGERSGLDAAEVDRVLAEDGFGKFAVLAASQDEYVQTLNAWDGDPATRAFVMKHDSDPWVLEVGEAGKLFQAEGVVTLDEVRRAFRAYHAGEAGWRAVFRWREIAG